VCVLVSYTHVVGLAVLQLHPSVYVWLLFVMHVACRAVTDSVLVHYSVVVAAVSFVLHESSTAALLMIYYVVTNVWCAILLHKNGVLLLQYNTIQYNTTYRTETCLSTSQRAVFGS
jgi:hypothetical protein